jgi:hypothetical protein
MVVVVVMVMGHTNAPRVLQSRLVLIEDQLQCINDRAKLRTQ